jgi:hypothetical protein
MRGIGEVVECRENAQMIRRERIARRTHSQIPGEAMQIPKAGGDELSAL